MEDLSHFSDGPELLLFFDALVRHGGAAAAAGRALKAALRTAGRKRWKELSAWADALEKPERGAGGLVGLDWVGLIVLAGLSLGWLGLDWIGLC